MSTIKYLDLWTWPDTNTWDPLRDWWQKINDNFEAINDDKMEKLVYDPWNKSVDCFNMDNMDNWVSYVKTANNYTDTDKNLVDTIDNKANKISGGISWNLVSIWSGGDIQDSLYSINDSGSSNIQLLSSNEIDSRISASAGWEDNTASNVWTWDWEVFKQKTWVDLELKTIKAWSNITITNNASDIEISATWSVWESNTASNIWTWDWEVFKQKTWIDLELKTIKAWSNITITNNASDIEISTTWAWDILWPTTNANNDIAVFDWVNSKTIQAVTPNTAFNKNFWTSSWTICQWNDSRLSDSRTPTTHSSSHIDWWTDEIDWDKLNITWSPTNYTPASTPTEVDWTDQLTSHLYWIDQRLGSSASRWSSTGSVSRTYHSTSYTSSAIPLASYVPTRVSIYWDGITELRLSFASWGTDSTDHDYKLERLSDRDITYGASQTYTKLFTQWWSLWDVLIEIEVMKIDANHAFVSFVHGVAKNTFAYILHYANFWASVSSEFYIHWISDWYHKYTRWQ